MDKQEKLKAARKKLKEFQSQSKKEVSADSEVQDTAQQEEPPKEVQFTSTEPANFSGTFFQQQQTSIASNAPQISNYFDGNSASFDFSLPQQSEVIQDAPAADVPHYTIPNVSQQLLTQQFIAPAPAPAAIAFRPEILQQTPMNNDRTFELQQQLEQQNQQIAQMQSALAHYQSNAPNFEQQNLQMTQLRSELEFYRTTATNLQKNIEELNKLRQDSQSHVDVVKVLVSEKTNLMDSLQKAELATKAKLEENEELQNRLNASRHRVKQLESEVRSSSNVKSSFELDNEAKRVEEIVAKQIQEFKESNERVEVEKNELKVLLSQKKIELENLQKNFDHLNTELHLANVRIAQLSDGTVITDTTGQPQISQLSQEVAIKQQQITELYSVIDQLNRDKEASDNQYQNYVSHLTREMETLKQNSIELTNENDELVKREQELLKHVGDLERQMQQQMQKQKTYAENQNQSLGPSLEELQKLSSQIAALTESNETLKSQVVQIEAEKSELLQKVFMMNEETKNIELQMEKLSTETPNLSRLMNDFEDKSVAASRALSQNQGLKDQLDEMQRAFITMTNDKMELTDKLHSEIHLCKEMKTRYDFMETELNEMRDKWQFKENEMIRLSHENTELEKKILQHNIEIDRLRHYESKEYHGTEGIVEKELENYKRHIEMLSNKINILESNRAQQSHSENHHDDQDGHGHSHSHGHGHSHEHATKAEEKDHKCQSDESRKHLLEEIEMLQMEKSELLKAIQDFQMSKKSENAETGDQEILTNGTAEHSEMTEELLQKLSKPKSVTPSMATEEALEKLQSRFRRTMLEVADLQEEKQRLEHVVTQLQFETETIGEYITLYQYQRRLLKQKEHERDIQLKNLAADREKMNQKLLQLNSLIEKFVLQHTDSTELAQEAAKFLDRDKSSEPLIINADNRSDDIMKLKQETAGKILEILSDIKTANSASYDTNIGVEHCSCCLGKLETV